MRASQILRQIAAAKIVFDKKKHFGVRDLARTHNWLSNSGDQPLDVHIKVSTDIKDTTLIASLLREHVSRFQMLYIQVPEHETAETLVSSIGEGLPAPLLERLDIHLEKIHSNPYPISTALPNSFHPCPRLKHLTIPGAPLPILISPHFTSLTSLTIDARPFYFEMNLYQLLKILDSTKNLLHFSYLGQDVFNYFTLNSPIISMPHLISADISVPGCGLDILCKLDAPLLTNVRFDGWRNETYACDWDVTLTKLIPPSLRHLSEHSPNLTHLELRSTVMYNSDDVYRWLLSDSAFPRLEVLRLYATDISDSTLRYGAGRMDSLKRLELLACMGVSGDGILKFVKGRNHDFELLIETCPGVKQEDRAKLSEFVKVL